MLNGKKRLFELEGAEKQVYRKSIILMTSQSHKAFCMSKPEGAYNTAPSEARSTWALAAIRGRGMVLK